MFPVSLVLLRYCGNTLEPAVWTMRRFASSSHIPVNLTSFFPGSGKLYEQGITTQDPRRPLTEGGTSMVQDGWETETSTEDIWGFAVKCVLCNYKKQIISFKILMFSIWMQAGVVNECRGRNIPLNGRNRNIKVHFKEAILSSIDSNCKYTDRQFQCRTVTQTFLHTTGSFRSHFPLDWNS